MWLFGDLSGTHTYRHYRADHYCSSHPPTTTPTALYRISDRAHRAGEPGGWSRPSLPPPRTRRRTGGRTSWACRHLRPRGRPRLRQSGPSCQAKRTKTRGKATESFVYIHERAADNRHGVALQSFFLSFVLGARLSKGDASFCFSRKKNLREEKTDTCSCGQVKMMYYRAAPVWGAQ